MCLVCLFQPPGLIWYLSINVLWLLELIPDYKHKDIFCFCFSHLVGPTDPLTKQTSPSTLSFSRLNINCLLLNLVSKKKKKWEREKGKEKGEKERKWAPSMWWCGSWMQPKSLQWGPHSPNAGIYSFLSSSVCRVLLHQLSGWKDPRVLEAR